MPLYEFECPGCSYILERWFPINERDTPVYCACGQTSPKHTMKRLPGGHKMLYFEEGRARSNIALGGKPITSHAEYQKRLRQEGAVEAPGVVPPSVAKNPKSLAMKRYLEKDKKGRWL